AGVSGVNEERPNGAVTVPEISHPLLEVDSCPSLRLDRDRQIVGHVVETGSPSTLPLDIGEPGRTQKVVGLVFTFTPYAAGWVCHKAESVNQRNSPKAIWGLFL